MWYRLSFLEKTLLKETERELKQHEKQIADQMEVSCSVNVCVYFVDN